MADDREAGFQPEPIEVGLLLESVRLHFAMTDQDGRLNISIADRSLRLFADPEMLGTAIINLVDNALKYSDRPTEISSAERRVGKEWVSTCRFRWSPDH